MIEKRPIRKDRVFLAVLFLVVVILIPVLLNTGGPDQEEESFPTVITPGEEEPAATTEPGEELPLVTEEPPDSEPVEITGQTIRKHVVTAGDTLSSIASLLGVTVDQIMASNRLRSAQAIIAGQTLYVPQEGILHTIKQGQTLTDISLTYAVTIEEIISANNIDDPSKIFAGERIIIPSPVVSPWENVVSLSRGQDTLLIWPVEGGIVSPFGYRTHPVLGYRHHHDGIDIDVPIGTAVHAAAMGKVSHVGEQESYGTYMAIEHANGYVTVYGHLQEVSVYKGQFVEIGQKIASSGSTGVSSGPQLYFEVRNQEFPIDPTRYLPQ